MSVKDEIRRQIIGALKDADFPVSTPEALLHAFPLGAETTCKAGEIEMTAGQAGRLLTADDFPFQSVDRVADVILSRAGL